MEIPRKKNPWHCQALIARTGLPDTKETYDGHATCGIHRTQENNPDVQARLAAWKRDHLADYIPEPRGGDDRKDVANEKEIKDDEEYNSDPIWLNLRKFMPWRSQKKI